MTGKKPKKPKASVNVRRESIAEAELRFLLRSRGRDRIATVLCKLIMWTGIIVIAYFARDSIAALAGKKTLADVDLNLLANINVTMALSYTAGISGTVYGIRQKQLREKTILRLRGRIKELELLVNPGLTSSQLTEIGRTREEDR